tara:strand:+ start:368 stop:589 length:222 start_codon:yes stop_codon:yes gene_type:complete
MKINLNELNKMDKYKENLLVSNTNIYSYLTDVATINHNKKEIIVKKWYSMTTLKHINYVANEYGYRVIKRYFK